MLNSLALAHLIYTSSIINTPKKAISEINNTIQNFMWDGSTSQILQQTLIQSIHNGGLKLCHFEIKVKALNLCWLERLWCNNNATWTILPQVFYKCSKINILFSRNQVLPSKLNIPRFYTDVYNLYIDNFKKEPLTIVETLNQSLWYNSFLNSKTLIHSF